MKKNILMVIALSLISPSCIAAATANCHIDWQEMNHSNHRTYDLKSTHAVAITNNSNAKKTYDIRYHSFVQLIDMWLLVAVKDKKITLEPGQSFNENYTLVGEVGKSEKGSYGTKAQTDINSKIHCVNYNKLKVH